MKELQQNEEIEQETEERFSLWDFCQETVSLLIMAYLFIVFCLYPFYLKSGYMDIGKDKYNFYKSITIGAFGLIIPMAAVCVCYQVKAYLQEKKAGEKLFLIKMSVTDWGVLGYGISVILSYLFSDYKKEALWGENGWYMGLVTQLLFVLSYFLVSRFWEYEEKLLLAFMAAASVVFVLGILNRFSVFPIELQGANSSFISTLGNINWYCGYWAVLFPIGFVLYWYAEALWLRLAGLLYTIIGIATGVSQGSTSAFIVFGGLYILLFCLSFRSRVRMKRFLELAMLFCAVCQGLRLWRIQLPDAFDYYDGTLCDRITCSGVTLYLLVFIGLLYFFFLITGRKKGIDMKRYKILRQIAILVTVLVVGVYVFLLVVNSKTEGGIRFMGQLPALVFSKHWGSSRGATWSAGVEIYKNLPIFRKLAGVGPDCFAMHLYTMSDLAKRVTKQFDGARLTNAHNEWLTVLVNNGLIGLLQYGVIFISAITRYIYHGEKKKYLYIFAISAFAYTIHNIVSFQQILSTPFMFLMLGMGESLIRTGKGNEECAGSK